MTVRTPPAAVRGVAALIAYLALALAACGPTLGNAFSGDDFIWLYDASRATSALDLFAVHDVPFAHYDGVRLNPTTNLFFAVGWPLFGMHPLPWHVFALALYVATALLVRAWLLELETGEAAAAFGGAVFLLHPLHAEPVAWLSATGEILVGLCAMISLLAWVRWRRRGRALWLAVSMLALIGAALAKESALALPLVLLLADLLLLGTRGARLGALLMPWLAAGLVAAWKALVLSAARDDIGIHPSTLSAADVAIGTFQYLASTVVGVSRTLSWGRSPLLASAVVGALLAAMAGLAARGQRRAAFHLAWMLVAVQPYVWWVPGQTLYERYTWQPSLPLACLAACAAAAASARLRRPARAALAFAAGALLVTLLLSLQAAASAMRLPDDTDRIAQSLTDSLRGLSPGDAVYVYNTLTTENAAGRAVVLLGGAAEGQVREWYDALQCLNLERHDRFLHFDIGSRRFSDVTDSVRAAHHLTVGRLNDTRPPRDLVEAPMTWGRYDDWTHTAALTISGTRVETSGEAGRLCSPRLDLSPWAVYAVDVLYVPRSGEVDMALTWRSAEQPAGGLDMTVAPMLVAPVPAGMMARFIPANQKRWWTGGVIRHLDLVPSGRAATVDVLFIRIHTFGVLH